jgi:hypothetical protein
MDGQNLKAVRDYYGQVLKTNADLKTSACCTTERPPDHIRALLKNVHPVVNEDFLCLLSRLGVPDYREVKIILSWFITLPAGGGTPGCAVFQRQVSHQHTLEPGEWASGPNPFLQFCLVTFTMAVTMLKRLP